MIERLIDKIHCADCLEFMKQIPDKSIDLVIYDAPYTQEAHGRGIAGKRKIYQEMAEYTNLRNDWYSDEKLDLFFAKCKFPNVFIFGGKRDLLNAQNYAVRRGFNFYPLPIIKPNPIPTTNNTWLPAEGCVHIADRKIVVTKEYRYKIPYFMQDGKKETTHPNEKNLSSLTRIILNLTQKNDIVFDPFSGSGTTAVACYEVGRRFIGVEKNKKYFEAALERLEKYQKNSSLFTSEDLQQHDLFEAAS